MVPGAGLKLVSQMTLMTMGLYNEPTGTCMPSFSLLRRSETCPCGPVRSTLSGSGTNSDIPARMPDVCFQG